MIGLSKYATAFDLCFTGKSFVFPSLDFDPHSQGGMAYVNIVDVVSKENCKPGKTLGTSIKIQGWEHETLSCEFSAD